MYCLIVIIALFILFVGVRYGYSLIFYCIGLNKTGPVAGGAFSLIQSIIIPITRGSLMASIQSLAMRQNRN